MSMALNERVWAIDCSVAFGMETTTSPAPAMSCSDEWDATVMASSGLPAALSFRHTASSSLVSPLRLTAKTAGAWPRGTMLSM